MSESAKNRWLKNSLRMTAEKATAQSREKFIQDTRKVVFWTLSTSFAPLIGGVVSVAAFSAGNDQLALGILAGAIFSVALSMKKLAALDYKVSDHPEPKTYHNPLEQNQEAANGKD